MHGIEVVVVMMIICVVGASEAWAIAFCGILIVNDPSGGVLDL